MRSHPHYFFFVLGQQLKIRTHITDIVLMPEGNDNITSQGLKTLFFIQEKMQFKKIINTLASFALYASLHHETILLIPIAKEIHGAS